MKRVLPLLILCILQTNHTHTAPSNKTIAAGALFGAGAGLGLYALYHRHKQPRITHYAPTLEEINTVTFTPQKRSNSLAVRSIEELVDDIYQRQLQEETILAIPTHESAWLVEPNVRTAQTYTTTADQAAEPESIFIVSRGYMRASTPGQNGNYIEQGGGAMSAYAQIADKLVNGTCVAFDYPDSWPYFSFGQTIETSCLKQVYDQVCRTWPNANIVLMGDCRGGKCALELLTHYPAETKRVKAVVLMSPFISGKELTEQISNSYLFWLPKSNNVLYGFFKWYYPQYDETQDKLLEQLCELRPDVPILIAHRMYDTLISNESMSTLVNRLHANGNPVWFLPIYDRTFNHSRLTGVPEVRRAVNSFFAQYGIAHYPEYAQTPASCQIIT